jgi:hypothetical protein
MSPAQIADRAVAFLRLAQDLDDLRLRVNRRRNLNLVGCGRF